jgi:putative ABC transport system permease protein
VPALVAMGPDGVPRLDQATVNGPVLAFALLASIVSAIVAGLAPAVAATRPDLRRSLAAGGRTAPASRERLRSVLVAGEVGLALMLLAGAGLLVRSALALQAVDPGFDPRGVLSARVTLPPAQYEDPARVTRTFEQVLRTLADAPSVDAAAITTRAPMANEGNSNGLVPEGQTFDPDTVVNAELAAVTGGYFEVMRIRLAAGRLFAATDTREAPLVMLLNETAARQLFPGQSALGKRVGCCEPNADGTSRYKTVIGVVGDVHSSGLQEAPRAQFYLPLAQAPPVMWTWLQRSMTLVARGRDLDPAALTGTLRAAVREADPTVPLYNVTTMEQRVAAVMAPARFNTVLMLILGGCGLLLAAIGIYGVITFFVAQRQRDIAIRVALGAPAAVVIRMVIAQGMRPVALGIAAGSIGALAGAQVLAAYVFGVTTRDPLTLAAVIGLLLVTAFAATFIPARRAASVNPARTLTSS